MCWGRSGVFLGGSQNAEFPGIAWKGLMVLSGQDWLLSGRDPLISQPARADWNGATS